MQKEPIIITGYTLGADPELFLFDNTSMKIIPGIGMVGGTKQAPKEMSKPGFTVQEDNVLIEFNIPPSGNKKEFVTNIISGLEQIKELFPKASGFVPLVQTSHHFSLEDLSDPAANAFGCDRDFNAWTSQFNIPPNVPEDGLRTAGGHVHVGYINPQRATSKALIRAMDFYLGIPSVLLDPDKERRRLYGAAGSFRYKDYGAEYRTLSSFWLKSPDLIGWVYDQTEKAIQFVNSQAELPLEPETIVDTINRSDIDSAKRLCQEHEITALVA